MTEDKMTDQPAPTEEERISRLKTWHANGGKSFRLNIPDDLWLVLKRLAVVERQLAAVEAFVVRRVERISGAGVKFDADAKLLTQISLRHAARQAKEKPR